ncbi:hypothetical protein [Asanoa sp. NPDC050611]|uniref:hypothetical protein n=1 Tax=Asanoa sp. NPDC050611 TaxID=3157098 RepID=UPI0033C30C84
MLVAPGTAAYADVARVTRAHALAHNAVVRRAEDDHGTVVARDSAQHQPVAACGDLGPSGPRTGRTLMDRSFLGLSTVIVTSASPLTGNPPRQPSPTPVATVSLNHVALPSADSALTTRSPYAA